MWAALQDCRRRKRICIPQPRERACEIRTEIGQISAVMDGERGGRDAITGVWRTGEAARHAGKQRPESGDRICTAKCPGTRPGTCKSLILPDPRPLLYRSVERERRLVMVKTKKAQKSTCAQGRFCNRTQRMKSRLHRESNFTFNQ